MARLLAACLITAPPAAQDGIFACVRASVKGVVSEGLAQANRDSPTKAQVGPGLYCTASLQMTLCSLTAGRLWICVRLWVQAFCKS